MKRLLFIAPVLAAALAGCDAVSERDCGVFDHPELALWQTDNGPATLTYTASDGTSIVFDRQNVVFSTPFLGTDGSSNDEDVVCELTATVRMQASDDSLAIITTYTQEEMFLLDSSDEVLRVDHQVESPVGTVLMGDYPADISDGQVRINRSPTRVRYLEADETAEFNGQAYEDVIRIYALNRVPEEADVETDTETETETETETDTETETETDSETDTETASETDTNEQPDSDSVDDNTDPVAGDVVYQIVLARNAGILAFTDAQNREFILMPAE